MSLTSGSRLGPYQVLGAIGAGGMGEVYRARDTRLDRDVALKILPEHFAADPERLARFEREAKTLASLNHPHIAQIYGIEDLPGTAIALHRSRALVMELVEGEDLSQRLARGPLPMDEALVIARQIAAALEAAHDLGIIHRDLKPANVKLRPDGTVKVLDFGLAKAFDRGEVSGVSPALANSPTITTPAMTQAGMILGTAAYMSPEQAKGKVVDRRTDLWAFGCVLFEMLTGKRAFAGDDVTDTLTAIFRDEPQWSALPSDTPATVQRLLRRCLQKDRTRRLDSAGMARIELDEPQDAQGDVIRAGREPSQAWRWVLAGGALAAAVLAGIALTTRAPAPDAQVIDFSLPLPPDLNFRFIPGGASVLLSPDARNLVYTSGAQGALVRRRLNGEGFEVFKERGTAPFFSPDSQWLGFFADGKLKKMPLDGGLATTICNSELGRGAWGDDGTIVFANRGGLFRVASSGGTPQPLGPAHENAGLAMPVFLPGARAVLVRVLREGQERIHAIRISDGTMHDLIDGQNAIFADAGQMLFFRDNQLWTVPIDTQRLAISGSAAPLLDGFRMMGAYPMVSLAANGSIAYMTADSLVQSTVVWLDRKGRVTPALPAPAFYQEPRLSPEGGRIAVEITRSGGSDIWVYDLARGTRLRLTSAGGNVRPRWSPDGKRLAFGMAADLYLRQADGSGAPEPLLVRPLSQFPDAWAPDGESVIYNEGGAVRDLWSIQKGQEPVRLLPESRFSERGASVSPDGKWLVFVSNESGREEIYVQSYPNPGPKVAVSTAGGWQPAWSRDGRELFYRQEDTMMVVAVGTDPTRAGAPQRLFDFPVALFGSDFNRVQYDVAADGRFLATREDPQSGGQEIRVVTNWLANRTRAAATPRP